MREMFPSVETVPNTVRKGPDRRSLNLSFLGDLNDSADDFLPMFTFVVVQAALPQLLIVKELMTALVDDEETYGECGYYLATLEASTQHIVDLAEQFNSLDAFVAATKAAGAGAGTGIGAGAGAGAEGDGEDSDSDSSR